MNQENVMKQKPLKRRSFMQKTTVCAAGLSLAGPAIISTHAAEDGKLALLGGKKVRTKAFPSWPVVKPEDEPVWNEVLHNKGWCRLDGNMVKEFEKKYAKLMGTKDCLATMNGTSALFASLNAIDIGPGDEVLVPPYTFVATINVVFLQHALPVFVDTDPNTFQMDPAKIEEKITSKTRAIIPVHLGGNVADMDAILKIAKKHNLAVIEDACQSHLAEWRGKKVGSMGDTGCFSFQVSKNLSGGEGGAVISNNTKLIDRCYSFQSNGRERVKQYGFNYINNGANLRMTEFQGAVLNQGMTRLEKQSQIREQNADYLTKQLSEIPGILPAEMYEGCTRNAYHLYMMRYDPKQFADVPRSQFLKALSAEGIPCAGGYSPLNKEPLIKETLDSRSFRAVYSKERLNQYIKENECPANDQLCDDAVWFFQTMLLAPRSGMDHIAAAIRKIHKNAGALAKA